MATIKAMGIAIAGTTHHITVSSQARVDNGIDAHNAIGDRVEPLPCESSVYEHIANS